MLGHATILISQDRPAQAVPFLVATLEQFSLLRFNKLLAMLHLARIACLQKDYTTAVSLAGEILRHDLSRRKGLTVRASLLMADSLMELGDAEGAGQTLARLHGRKLRLAERLQVLPVLLRWQMLSGKYVQAVLGLEEKVQLAGLMESEPACLVHVLLAAAAQSRQMREASRFLLRRARLHYDLATLAQRNPSAASYLVQLQAFDEPACKAPGGLPMTTWPLRRRTCSRLSRTRSRISCALIPAMWVLALTCAASHAAQSPLQTSGGYWLLDLAWDRAAGLAQAPTRADAMELLCLLQAATRLDPRLPEAWRQQYDLLSGLGRHAEALQALARYVELAPDDEPAVLTYVAQQVASAQTAEARMGACNTWLSRKGIPPVVKAFLHRTMAEILAGRLQTEQAIRYARLAVDAFPYDLAAQRLLLDLTNVRGILADLQVALWSVRRNPLDAASLAQVAAGADALGLYEDAAGWYAQSLEVMSKLDQDTTSLTLRIAEHHLDAGQADQAIGILSPLAAGPKPPLEVSLLQAEAYTLKGDPDRARQAAIRALRIVSPAAADEVAASQPTATAPATGPAAASRATSLPASRASVATTRPVPLPSSSASQPVSRPAAATQAVAGVTTQPAATQPIAGAATQPADLEARVQADWIRAIYLSDPAVLADAANVYELYRDQPWARRMYAWALLEAGQADRAAPIFATDAKTDPWSALGLARSLYEQSDRRGAGDALSTLQRIAPTGAAQRAAQRWARRENLPFPAPPQPLVHEAKILLDAFNKALLNLPMRPGDFLQIKVTLDAAPDPGEPWFGRIELTNISDVPIYCGPDGALMPNVMITAATYDPATRDLGQHLLLSLHRQFVLAPGRRSACIGRSTAGRCGSSCVIPTAMSASSSSPSWTRSARAPGPGGRTPPACSASPLRSSTGQPAGQGG